MDPNPIHTNLSGTYLIQDYPKPLTKKYKLLRRFRDFLSQQNATVTTKIPSYLASTYASTNHVGNHLIRFQYG